MATVQVQHTLGGAEIMRLLCTAEGSGFGLGRDKESSRRQVEAAIRMALEQSGVQAYADEDQWEDSVPGDEVRPIALWAARTLLRLWPESVDGDLRQYAQQFGVEIVTPQFGPTFIVERA